MSTNFPTSFDAFTNPNPTDDRATVSPSSAVTNLNSAVSALETKLGIDSSAVTTSIDYLLKSTSSSNPGHKHTLVNGATDVTSSAAELNTLDGITSSTAELNILTGVTATAAEINVLDGIPPTLTATELGYVDGVTSAIQTQLNAKAPSASPTFTGTASFGSGVLAATRPKITTSIDDANGNEVVITPATASAVNEVTITNAAASSMPAIAASGGDSVIALKLTGKSAFVAASGEYNAGNSGANITVDFRNGDRQLITVTAATTIAFSNALAGQVITLRIVEDGTGNYTIALNPTTKWPNGAAGSFTTTPNAINLLTVYYDGTNYLYQLSPGFA